MSLHFSELQRWYPASGIARSGARLAADWAPTNINQVAVSFLLYFAVPGKAACLQLLIP